MIYVHFANIRKQQQGFGKTEALLLLKERGGNFVVSATDSLKMKGDRMEGEI